MRDAAIAPVEHDVVAVADEDVAVMEVVVLDGLRDPDRGELLAEVLHLGDGCEQALVLVLVEAVLAIDEQYRAVRQHVPEMSG